MKRNKLTTALLLATTLSVPLSAMAATGYMPWKTNEKLTSDLNEQQKLISDQINKQKQAYVKNIQTNTETIVEAIRVATAQEALSSVQVGKADLASKQVLVNALQADAQAENAMKVIMRFSPSTGQGYAACKVLAENSQLSQVMNTVYAQAAVKVNEGDNSPLAMASSLVAANTKRTEDHNANFCTDAEGVRAVCKPVAPELQGADSNAGVLFVPAPAGSKTAAAKQSVRQNILGSPIVAIPAKMAGSAAGQAYLYAVNHKTALSAFPAYSLAYLESMSEVRDDVLDADGKPSSPNDMLFNTVARYYGGADAAEWQSSMVAQQPRGLLVELAKMEGLGAWTDYQTYLAMQRMEGNIAAMTLTAAIPMEQRLEKQRVRSVSQSVRDNLTSK